MYLLTNNYWKLKKPEENQASMGFKPTLYDLCNAGTMLYQLSYQATLHEQDCFISNLQCVVPENIHTPPHSRDWKFLGMGVLKDETFKKEYIEFNWNFQRGRGGGAYKKKSLPCGKNGYFMELHNLFKIIYWKIYCNYHFSLISTSAVLTCMYMNHFI